MSLALHQRRILAQKMRKMHRNEALVSAFQRTERGSRFGRAMTTYIRVYTCFLRRLLFCMLRWDVNVNIRKACIYDIQHTLSSLTIWIPMCFW